MNNEFKRFSFKDVLANLTKVDESIIGDYLDFIKNNNTDIKILNLEEEAALETFERLYKDSGHIPTIELFNSYYPKYKIVSNLEIKDIHGLISVFIKQRKNLFAANELTSIAKMVREEGVTPDISDKVSNILKLDAPNRPYEKIEDRIISIYESMLENSGIKTGIGPVDEVIGGLKAGQVSVIAGFTGMGKSICSLSIMHSALEQGYNVCYISLELSAEHLMYNLISRHSLERKFTRLIEHRDLKSKTLGRSAWDYVKSDILPDLQTLPGKFYILDEQDLESYDYFSFDNKLQEIENLCFEETGKGLDLIIVDHIQMLAFSDQGNKISENTVINRWCNYFRSQCLDFLKSKRQIHVILVSQVNRQGYKKAAKNGGMYDMTSLKEANEIETCASVILGVFSDTALINSSQAKVGVLKNRDGSRVGSAYQVPANYPYQLIGSVGTETDPIISLDNYDCFGTFDEKDWLDNNQDFGISFFEPATDEDFNFGKFAR